jgi:hypothetical protein
LSAASPVSVIRSPSNASRSTDWSFRVISWTAGAVRLRNVDDPGAAQPNLTTLSERNVFSSPVRSRSTW